MTLPSNSSAEYYPENKTSDFKVHLPKELDLNGSWEVGIAEIFYPNSWYNIDSNDLWIYFVRGGVYIRTKPPGGYYQKESQFVQQLLNTMKQEFKLKNQQLIAAKTIDTEVDFSLDIKYNNQTQICEIHIDHKNSETTEDDSVNNSRSRLFMSVALANILGFSQRQFDTSGVFTGERSVDINAVTAIYIYCDIIQFRTVGHVLAPLLGVVPVEGRSGALVSKRYEKIQYHSLSKRNIADIHISLRDDQGNFIQFRRGKVIVSLHFRKKRLDQL